MTDLKETEGKKEEVFPTHEEIETRAYELYLKGGGEGREDGRTALDDWLAAEGQLRQEYGRGTTLKSEPVLDVLRRERAKASKA